MATARKLPVSGTSDLFAISVPRSNSPLSDLHTNPARTEYGDQLMVKEIPRLTLKCHYDLYMGIDAYLRRAELGSMRHGPIDFGITTPRQGRWARNLRRCRWPPWTFCDLPGVIWVAVS
jgi:hypothetical protein